MPKKLLPAILLTCLIAGSLDILLAFATAYFKSGATPDKVLKFIASGVIGKKAFTGDSSVILLGLFLHYIIAFVFTAILFYIFPRVAWVGRNKILSGAVYGVLVWLLMNKIVLPLSKVPQIPFDIVNVIIGILVLIVAIGWPLTYFANKFYSVNRNLKSQPAAQYDLVS